MSQPARSALLLVRSKRRQGLSDEALEILLLVHESTSVDQQEIIGKSGINPHTVRRVVGVLCKSGHLLADKGEDDARERTYRLSDHGKRLVKSILQPDPA